MASTNKTTNYELSQYIGTDKPTYLGDYNSDMSKIDTAVHNNATAISGVGSSITQINNNIGTLANLTTTDKSSVVNAINEVDSNCDSNATKIGTLSNLETENKTTVVNAINEIVEKFNLTEFESFDVNNITSSGLSNLTGTIYVATNNDGSIFKIYGSPLLSIVNTGTISFNTKIRPSSNITLNSAFTRYFENGSRGLIWIGAGDIEIDTTGKVTITNTKSFTESFHHLIIPPCLYFAKDFGDVPTPEPNA